MNALPAASIVFYTDETATGNVQRYDKTRILQCFYWTLKEFPSWMHKRKAGWFPYGYMQLSLEEQMWGGLISVFKQVVHHFFVASLNVV